MTQQPIDSPATDITDPVDYDLPTVKRLRRLSYILDSSIPIPGTGYRIGIDPILGLLPVWGDIAGAILSGYIVLNALKLGISRKLLLTMIYNILAESIIGVVPVLGNIFDATWKANMRNMRLLDAHIGSPSPSRKVSLGFMLLVLLGGLLLLVGGLVVAVVMLRWLIGRIWG
ncbi:DUF4112 domain-containing protein [Geitlerinema sp. P-1104]|uniref:DUF4112 domain-containing protein n=1 Tax=Geitlerinema sp. P-1104 TaxID=2546230 RepID=UPI0014776891|nr:DUF4112 domain-containing protein [Geitlerinema sp. P-1104]NMG57447.1 DUF4112 domain-containing protein [Geitlerinema sp. P-1104]